GFAAAGGALGLGGALSAGEALSPGGAGGGCGGRGGGGVGGCSSLTFSSSACVGAVFGTPAVVMPCCAACSQPSATPASTPATRMILNSTRRFFSRTASLSPGSSGQKLP